MTGELLALNGSVTKLLDAVARNQQLLRDKLALALEASDGCCAEAPPCPPPCPTPARGAISLQTPEGGFLWRGGCLLPWVCAHRQGDSLCWSADAPTWVRLAAGKAYAVSLQLNICDFLPSEASGSICLELDPEDAYPPQLPFWYSIRCAAGETATLQYSALLLPRECAGARLAFRLRSTRPLCVCRGALSIAEI